MGSTTEVRSTPRHPRLRLSVLGSAVALAFALIMTHGIPSSPQELREAVASFGWIGPAIMLAAWILLTPALVSGTLLALAGGLAFGAAIGTGVAIAGALAGGLTAFLLARRFGHRAAQQLSGPRLARLQERLARRGFLTVFVAGTLPGLPTTWLNWACGLSRIRLRHYAAGLAAGGAPKLFAYTSLGSSGGDLSSGPALLAFALLACIALLGLAVAALTRAAAPA